MHARHKVENARILIVEDEYFIMSDLHRIIDGGGNVCVAYNRMEDDVLELDYSSVQIVIIDANLRNGYSFKIADMLKDRDIPFIFSAGCANNTIPEKYQDAPCLAKPYDERALADIISQRIGPPR